MAGIARDPARHPFLAGNYAPVRRQLSLEACDIQGTVPEELIGGQYVRNGSNPLPDSDPKRALHWFDGHGMLSAVYFCPAEDLGHDRGGPGAVRALYSNQYVLTDVYLAESKSQTQGRPPILPSIATLIDPASSLWTIVRDVLRTIWIVLGSWLDGSLKPIKRISVANTGIVSHNGRFLATCESGPPMRVSLPLLKTVGWFDGRQAAGEPKEPKDTLLRPGFGGRGLLSFFHEWTTGHPHMDPVTGEMLTFHSTFFRPFVRYSVLAGPKTRNQFFGQPVPGIQSPKMMHDFGVSRRHTVIVDMPLSLNPFDLAFNKPAILFKPKGQTRFGVFPRYLPHQVQWFATAASCVFHTVNTWDEIREGDKLQTTVNMLACRMTGPSMVYVAGNLPVPGSDVSAKEECCLYYYRFTLDGPCRGIAQQWALSAIPFEFPHVPKDVAMSATRFVYGCSLGGRSFAEFGDAAKIDSLVKVDVQRLIARGLRSPPTAVSGCVDMRSIGEVLAADDPDDPIQIFPMPDGVYAQECTFVPRVGGASEDDGWLLTFVFDEAQLDAEGHAPGHARSELWVIDAKTMRHVVARVGLPQRVPYGLHGNWFSKEEIAQQRPVQKYQTR